MNEYKSQIRTDMVISVLCFAAGIVFGIYNMDGTGIETILGVIVSGTMLGGLRYGWNLLTFLTPNIFLFMPLIGWVIYFLVKLILSLIIAPFAFVFKTIANIIALVQ